MKTKRKIKPNDVLAFGVLTLAAVVLVKVYNVANEYQKIAKKINTRGFTDLL